MHGTAIVFAGACLLGTIPLFSHPLHHEGIPVTVISAIRLAFSCILAMSMMAWSGHNPFRCGKLERRALLFLGIIGSGMTSVFYTASLKYTTIAIAILAVFCTVPITTYVMDKVYRQFRLMHLLCFTLVFLGFGALSWDKFSGEGDRQVSEHLIGIAFGVLTGICFGTYAPFGKRLVHLRTSVTLCWAFGVGFLIHLPFIGWMESASPPWSTETVVNLVCLGLFGCFLPYLLIQIGMKSPYVSSMQVSMLFLLEPVISVFIGFHFGETLSAWNVLGVASVFLSIFLFQFHVRSRSHE
ncbi:MAG: DMT family transporter [Candidatus Peribacteraceae bacterium]|nr:DMT family transporter [Candidatus Peribacteraceae bacterium]